MLKIDIISGFLGAGKTTLIKKLLQSAYVGKKVVLIENEFGDIGIDGGFLKEAGIEISEINSGCICCSLVGDFSAALRKVSAEFAPDIIVIEPSGVGKLSDVEKAVLNSGLQDAAIGTKTTVVDAAKCKMYYKNFGEFYIDQIQSADCVILSHADVVSQDKLDFAVETVRACNPDCVLVTTPYQDLDGNVIYAAMTKENTLARHIESTLEDMEHEHHHHHHDEDECDDPDCECHHHHHHHDDDDEDEHEHHHHHHHDEEECDDPDCECHHHHHDDDDDEDEHEHHHHHHHDEEECDDPDCECHHHHHDDEDEHEHHHHHHHHDAHDSFVSWGIETTATFTRERLKEILEALNDRERYGFVLRAKGMVKGENEWIYFDFVPEFVDIRAGQPDVIGKLCVIGHEINKHEIAQLFKL